MLLWFCDWLHLRRSCWCVTSIVDKFTSTLQKCTVTTKGHGRCTVQLKSNLTLVFDYLQVFTDFVRVPDQWSCVMYLQVTLVVSQIWLVSGGNWLCTYFTNFHTNLLMSSTEEICTNTRLNRIAGTCDCLLIQSFVV